VKSRKDASWTSSFTFYYYYGRRLGFDTQGQWIDPWGWLGLRSVRFSNGQAAFRLGLVVPRGMSGFWYKSCRSRLLL
jgi:hypothetical protein